MTSENIKLNEELVKIINRVELKFIKVNKSEYSFLNARASRKFGFEGDTVLLKKTDNVYILKNKDEFLSDFHSCCRTILKKHPSWAKWSLRLNEIKELNYLDLSSTQQGENEDFEDIYSVDMIPCYINYFFELNKLITKYGAIVKKYIDPLTYRTDIKFEHALDTIYTHIHNVQKTNFTESFFSKKHKHLITPVLIDKFDYLQTLIEKNKIQKSAISNFITKKVAIIKNSEELVSLTDAFINDLTGYSISNKLKELEEDNVCIVYQDTDVIIAEIDQFGHMKKHGSKQWCISQQEHYFNQYLNQHREINRQFILWDFSRPVDDIYSMIGFTLNLLNDFKASHLKNDAVTPIECRSKIKSKIPKITEDVKFNVIKNRGLSNSDTLLDAYRYDSDKAKVWVKKMIRLSEEEDQVTSVLTFLKISKDISSEEVNAFVKDIDLEIENLEAISLKRLINIENTHILDIVYPCNSDKIHSVLETRSYVNVSYFNHVYVNYLSSDKINKNIINEFISKYSLINNAPSKSFLDQFSQNQTIRLITKIVSESLIDSNIDLLTILILKLSKSTNIAKDVYDKIKESYIDNKIVNKHNMLESISSFIKFCKINEISLDEYIPIIMFIFIKCNAIDSLYEYIPKEKVTRFKVSNESTKDITQSLMNKNQSYLLGSATSIMQAVDLGWFDISTKSFKLLIDRINTIRNVNSI
jgi:hypothetical protein